MALARVLCPTLIGRESELSALEDALLAALRGDGALVIVGGEAGMGKTRLVSELTARASRLRCVVMSGACSEAVAFRVRVSAEAGLRAKRLLEVAASVIR